MKQCIALLLAAVLLFTAIPMAAAEQTQITLSGKTEIEVGESAVWTAEVSPAEQNTAVTWKSGWPAVATVDENGVVTGHRTGECHITAVAPDGTTKTVTVRVVSYDVTELQLAGRTLVRVGETVNWTAKPLPEGAVSGITWAAGYPAVATVDGCGNITAHKVGDCHITATAANGVKKTVTVRVREIEKIELSGEVYIAPGETTTWTAKPLPEGLQSKITWASGYPAVATVDQNGTITAHRVGDCHITATADNGVKKTVMLHVMSPADVAMMKQFKHVLSSCDSPHTDIPARTNNLILACKAIDGKILQPGEVFSYNETVGKRTAERGYQAATIYVGGGEAPGLGGGVCQVASNVYMCTLLADLQVLSRREHMFSVTYVPPGMDATVYWGSLDYKFRNTFAHPILIRASVSDGYVHMQFLSTHPSDVTVKMTYEVVSTSPKYNVQTYKHRYDADGKLLSTEKCAYSSYSYHYTPAPKPAAKPVAKPAEKPAATPTAKPTVKPFVPRYGGR